MDYNNRKEKPEDFIHYACGYCGETNEVLIEESIGKNYEVIEDCLVCCRPNIVHIFKEEGRWECRATSENE
ncbi:MAG: CPXCG motif-containing cysteine-rich protein [Nitrospiria bacterium]